MSIFKKLFCKHEGKLEHIKDYYGDQINQLPRFTRSEWRCPKCGKILYKEYLSKDIIYVPAEGICQVSDGYHTFDSLYFQRLVLFATICNLFPELSWKSKKHENGKECFGGGWFIVGIKTPEGEYTYHYKNKYWDMFKCKELDVAKHWDGHTDKDVERLLSLTN